MEFKFRAGQRRDLIFHPSSSSSSSSSSSYPLLFPRSGYTPSPPLPALPGSREAAALEEALRREHKKDIICQEILMREEAEWRIREAEVRQEMQLERFVVIPPPPPPPTLTPARWKHFAVAEKRTAINKKTKNKKKKKTVGSSRRRTIGKWSCSVCRTTMTCEEDLHCHLNGKRHNATLRKMG